MRYFFFIICGLAVSGGVFLHPAAAAVVSLKSDIGTLHVGDIFSVQIQVDTEHETLNALESTVTFPSDLLSYVASADGDSVVSLWIQKPTLQDTNVLSFSGVTPGGFVEANAPIVTLTFKVLQTGQGTVQLANSVLLKHDGAGTPAVVSEQSLHLSVVPGSSGTVVNTLDTEIPEHFTPQIIHDPDIFAGAAVLVFSTKDKGSGLDYYEIKEGWWGRYVVATSPYHLNHQALDLALYVKAVDQVGNARVEIVYPHSWHPWYLERKILGTIVVSCVLILFILWRVFGRCWRSEPA